MPIPHPSLPKAPPPTRVLFDPFNSSSTGHQRAENVLSGSTSWRDSRTYKLASQFKDSSGRGGEQHLSDLVGAGSKEFGKDGRKRNGDWEKGAPGLREDGWQDIRGMMTGSRKRGLEENRGESVGKKVKMVATFSLTSSLEQERHTDTKRSDAGSQRQEREAIVPTTSATDISPAIPPKQFPSIFKGLTIYLNGSTAPLISDHKLKSLVVSHGGNVGLGLARRTVTHVIIGETGLAAGSIQKEVRKVRGESVKYVTALWVIDCVEAGRRKAEGPYLPEGLGIGGSRQKSVGRIFAKVKGS